MILDLDGSIRYELLIHKQLQIKEIFTFLVQTFPFRVQVRMTGHLERISSNHLQQLSRRIVFNLGEVVWVIS